MEIENRGSALNTVITDRAIMLHTLLELDDIGSIDTIIIDGEDIQTYYNKNYFRVVGNTITDVVEHEYKDELDNLFNIDFTLVGELKNTSMYTTKTEEVEKLDYLLAVRNDMGTSVNMYPNLLTYNSAYFTVVDSVLDVKPEFKKYIYKSKRIDNEYKEWCNSSRC